MPDYITPTGFEVRRQDDIKTDLENKFKEIYGEDVQLSPESTNGQKIGIWSESLADVWNLAELVYSSFNPSAVIGIPQDVLYTLNGITRLEASASTVALLFTGDEGYIIPAGFQVANSLGLTFETDEDVEIVAGEATVSSTCTITGAKAAGAGTLTIQVNAAIQIASVTNPLDAVLGRDQETNSQYRVRRFDSTAIAALNMLESLYSQLANLSEVISVKIYDNKTDLVDPNGIPPHSFMAIVEGGADQEIGDIIWKNSPVGIGGYADDGKPTYREVEIVSSLFPDVINIVRFQRPTPVEIYVLIEFTKDGRFPGDGEDQIKQNIVDYAAGLLEETGFSGFGIGQDVYQSRLYAPCNLVQGHNIRSLLIGTAPDPATETDIPIDFDAKSAWSIDRITFEEVS